MRGPLIAIALQDQRPEAASCEKCLRQRGRKVSEPQRERGARQRPPRAAAVNPPTPRIEAPYLCQTCTLSRAWGPSPARRLSTSAPKALKRHAASAPARFSRWQAQSQRLLTCSTPPAFLPLAASLRSTQHALRRRPRPRSDPRHTPPCLGSSKENQSIPALFCTLLPLPFSSHTHTLPILQPPTPTNTIRPLHLSFAARIASNISFA